MTSSLLKFLILSHTSDLILTTVYMIFYNWSFLIFKSPTFLTRSKTQTKTKQKDIYLFVHGIKT